MKTRAVKLSERDKQVIRDLAEQEKSWIKFLEFKYSHKELREPSYNLRVLYEYKEMIEISPSLYVALERTWKGKEHDLCRVVIVGTSPKRINSRRNTTTVGTKSEPEPAARIQYKKIVKEVQEHYANPNRLEGVNIPYFPRTKRS